MEGEAQYAVISGIMNAVFALLVMAGDLVVVYYANKKRWQDWETWVWVGSALAFIMFFIAWRQCLGAINAYVAPEMVINKQATLL